MDKHKAAHPPPSHLIISDPAALQKCYFCKKQIHCAFLKKYKRRNSPLQKANVFLCIALCIHYERRSLDICQKANRHSLYFKYNQKICKFGQIQLTSSVLPL